MNYAPETLINEICVSTRSDMEKAYALLEICEQLPAEVWAEFEFADINTAATIFALLVATDYDKEPEGTPFKTLYRNATGYLLGNGDVKLRVILAQGLMDYASDVNSLTTPQSANWLHS